jgi:ParB family chromosome partitioning protein
LNLVDQKKIAITLAVEISYLDIQIQKWIYEYVKENGFLKKEQIEAIRSAGNTTEMTQFRMIELMNDALPKPKDNGKVMLPGKKLNQYFPAHYSAVQREEIILRLLSEWSKENKPAEV